MLSRKLPRPAFKADAEAGIPIDLVARVGSTQRHAETPPAVEKSQRSSGRIQNLRLARLGDLPGSQTTGPDDRGRPLMIGAQEPLPVAGSATTKIGALARRTRDPGELLANATSQLAELFDADGVSIMLADDVGQLSVRSSVGLSVAARHDRKKIGEGISGFVAQSGQPLLLSGPMRDHRFPGNDRCINESIVAPLLADDRIIGVVNIKHRFRSGAVWARTQVETLTRVASEIAQAFVTAEAMQRVERDRHQAIVLYELSRLATLDDEPWTKLESAAAMLADMLSHDVIGVWVLEPTGGLRLGAGRGYGRNPPRGIAPAELGPLMTAALAEDCIKRGRYPDGDPTRPTWAPPLGNEFLVAPIGSGRIVYGALVLGRSSAQYTEADAEFAGTIGKYLSASLQNVIAAESLEDITARVRCRIAQEIHDDIVQDLTAVVRNLEECQRAMEKDPSLIGASLAEAARNAHATLAQLRQSATVSPRIEMADLNLQLSW